MPIINIARDESDALAQVADTTKPVHLRAYDARQSSQWPDIWLYDTHVGYCLEDREINGYDDSDWYMIVWNPVEGKTEQVVFASTCGWTYPCYCSRPDATPEVRAAADAWIAAERRKTRICARWNQRKADMALARDCGLADRFQLDRLRHALVGYAGAYEGVVRLLKTKRFRSSFRQSMAMQVRAWLADAAPRYNTPLSSKQLRFIG
jgi:hypothetical protein